MFISAISESLDVADALTPAKLVSSDRDSPGQSDKENIMKRFAITTMLAGSIFAGLVGTAGAAHADLSDVIWSQQQQQRVHVPHVDNTVRANTTIVRH